MYTRWGGYVEDVDRFDAAFFGFSPREASRIDPQHRMLLELTQEALEDAGIPTDRLAGSRAGVFVGVSTHDYGDMQMWPSNRTRIDAHSNAGVAGSIAANRISYAFDLRGPSMIVDTACSSSLTAAHLALRSLADGECDLAIVGGAQLLLTPEVTIGFCKASMISPDGRCRAFDASGNGYVRSEGAGVVVLKPLAEALAAGDRVYAVLLGSSVNQDGRTTGMTVPSSDAQAEMLRESLRRAGIGPAELGYVEAHGTGTPVGDPLEAAALGAVLAGERAEPVAIGSVKTNIGHLEAAAGMAGLIKTALAIHHGELPPSLHFRTPNPAIDFEAQRLRVVTELEPWPGGDGRVAAVSSFGFGGANASVVLRDPPSLALPAAAASDRPELLPLSARSPEALEAAARAYLDLLSRAEPPVAEICAAASLRRAHHDHRLAVAGTGAEELADGLDAFIAGERRAAVTAGRRPATGAPPLAFVFSGMGPQWWGMGRQLSAQEPVFRAALERCHAALEGLAPWSLLEELGRDETTTRVGEADLAQVTNFAIQVALAELWASWGIRPDAVVGHSAGEIAAAYVSGALDLDDAVLLAYHRSRLQARATGRGKMLAAGVTREEAERLAASSGGKVFLAAVNGPASVTLSGDGDALQRLLAELESRQVFARMLPVLVPYHSDAMDAIEDELLESLASLTPRDGDVPFVSVVTGEWTPGSALDGSYWWRNVRQPVLFAAGIERLLDDGYTTFLELGPHPVLAASVNECLAGRGGRGTVLGSIRRKEDERAAMLRSLGALYAEGRTVDWSGLHGERVPHVDLPRYPWQRERHWFEPVEGAEAEPDWGGGVAGAHPLLARRLRGPRAAWETRLGGDRHAWLDDHVLQGTVPFPGAGYLELGLAAARELLDTDAPVVRGVDFRRALFLGERAATLLQLSVDPATRRFEVHANASRGEGEWTLHCEGSLGAAEQQDARVDLDAVRGRCTDELERGPLYERLAARGFAYGAAFRGIERAWVGGGEALARVRLAEPLDVDGFEVHPALLDAAVQTLIVAADSSAGELGAERRGFLPVRVDELRLHGRPGAEFWARARAGALDGETFTGEVDLLDERGEVVAAVRGLACRLLDAAQGGTEAPADWLYEHRWESDPDTVPALDAEQLAREVGWADYYTGVEPLLEQAAAGFALAALRELGWEPGTPAEDLRVPEENAPLVHALVGGVNAAEATSESPDAILERVRVEFPAYELDAELLARCGRALAGVLSGATDAVEVLFSENALALLTRFYAEAPTARFYNALLARAAAELAASRNGAGPLRVLEVGAGTGGTTVHVLPALPDGGTSYLFTDVSPLFASAAKRRFPGVEAAVLDVERPPEEQGFSAGSFDLVVAANVLHATPDLRRSLANMRHLLAPGGSLLLLEITRRPFWLELVFGLTEGWWRFSDRDLRPDHALLDAPAWTALLAEEGFEGATAIHDVPADGVPGQAVLRAHVGAANGGEPAGADESWLLLADRGGIAEAVAASLGGRVTLVADEAELEPALARARERGPLTGVVHLWALDAPATAELTGESFLAAQERATASVFTLLRVLGDERPQHGVALVTRGAQEQSPDAEREALALAQAPLWGVGRVLFRERPDLRSRMIDLTPSGGSLEFDALVRELRSGSDESELALRGERRLVRRLRRVGPADTAPDEHRPAGPDDSYRLTIGTPGALESLAFRDSPRRPPGPREVELRVAAASLNFRDVMLAMGLLPQRAIEEIAGARLFGLDCAGVVVAVGDEVTEVAVGDAVLANGSGSLASHLTTHVELVAPKPASLSFEEGATIPIAFVTAQASLDWLARTQPGERVLIHAATGGVGLAAVQVARALGAEVLATAGSDEKRAFLRSLGIEHVFDSRSLAFADDVLRATGGRGVDVVLNSLSGAAIERGIDVLAPFGRFVEIGKRDVYEDAQIGLLAFRNNLSYFVLELDRLELERPELAGRLFREVMRGFAEGTYTVTPHSVFAPGEVEDALRLMAQARHIGKIVVRMEDGAEIVGARARPQRPVSDDGTILVTGGLGGFGLAVARRLVEEGARTLALVGRSAPSTEASRGVAELVEAGARVEVLQADVSRAEDVARVLETIRTTLPPLRSVVHAAMVLDDAPLEELDAARLGTALAGKAAGAWNLHLATLDEQLDHFVLYSSIAGTLGNAHQGNYAAANVFVDALAEHRHALGLPALAIQWGVLSGVGYVADHGELGPYLARQGYLSFDPEQALDLLVELLAGDRPQVMAAKIDWARLAASAPDVAATPRLRHFRPAAVAADGASQTAGSSALAGLLEGPASERGARVAAYLQGRLGRVLGIPAERVEVERPLVDMGLDSLIAVELMTMLRSELGVELAVVRLLDGITLADLAGVVLEQLPASTPAAAPVPVAREAAPVLEPEPADAEPERVAPQAVAATNGDVRDYGTLDYERWTRGQRLLRRAVSAGIRAGARVHVEGTEHVPRDGGFVLATNHLSMADVPLLLTLMERPTIVIATDELKSFPWLDWVLGDLGNAIYVRRDAGEVEALEPALTVLRSGGIIGVGPEGRRSATGALESGRTGVAYLATRAGVPVLPVAAWGQERLGRGLWRLRRAPVTVRFGQPLHFPAGEAGPAELRAYTEDVMQAIARLLPPEYRGVYAGAVS
jgi:1-acyl-sn-glycerol-3-phosphate acyltransferase